jgi:hypothetical protein
MKGGLPPNGSHHQFVPPRCPSGPRISNGISWNMLLEKNNGLSICCAEVVEHDLEAVEDPTIFLGGGWNC